MPGVVRNGHTRAAYTAQSTCDGGSDDTRFTAHIGPTRKPIVSSRQHSPPHVQHSPSAVATSNFRVSATRKSGAPSNHCTNHGTGRPTLSVGSAAIAEGIGTPLFGTPPVHAWQRAQYPSASSVGWCDTMPHTGHRNPVAAAIT